MQAAVHWSELAANLGQALTGLAVVVGGGWALVTYRNAKRAEAAKWLFEVFNRFQVGKAFKKAKLIFDFEYREVVEPILGRAVFYGTEGLLREERQPSVLIDRVLNYLEHLMYMKANRHVTEADCRAYFGYWLGLLEEPERGALRRYLHGFGYDRLSARVNAHEGEYLLVYGTLGSEGRALDDLEVRSKLTRVGTRTLRGALYDLGPYPGFVPGTGPASARVEAELFRIEDLEAIHVLDEHEEYDPRDLEGSMYLRRTLRVDPPGSGRARWFRRRPPPLDAWIYVYNGPVEDRPRIRARSWREHVAARRSAEERDRGPQPQSK